MILYYNNIGDKMQQYIGQFIDFITNFVEGNNMFLSVFFGVFAIVLESIIPALPLALFIAINIIAFGNFWGFIISWLSTVAGCTLSFFICRKFRGFVERKFKNQEKVLGFINRVDEIKFSRAVTNLIENAIKYNKDDGEVRVTLNADHNYFYIKITDTGVGIPEDAKDKIFERFYRVDKARSRDTGGTGLGLAITKSIIQLHHGVIRVHSELGEGSIFHIRIPLNYIS